MNEVNQGCQMQYLTDDIIVEEADNEEQGERMRDNVQLVDNEELQSTVAIHKDDNGDNVVPGVLKVIIFFIKPMFYSKFTLDQNQEAFCIISKKSYRLCLIFEVMALSLKIYLGAHLINSDLFQRSC